MFVVSFALLHAERNFNTASEFLTMRGQMLHVMKMDQVQPTIVGDFSCGSSLVMTNEFFNPCNPRDVIFEGSCFDTAKCCWNADREKVKLLYLYCLLPGCRRHTMIFWNLQY